MIESIENVNSVYEAIVAAANSRTHKVFVLEYVWQ